MSYAARTPTAKLCPTSQIRPDESETGLPWLRCIYKWDKFEVEGHAAASFDSDSSWKSNRKLICRIVDGLAVGVRPTSGGRSDMPATVFSSCACAKGTLTARVVASAANVINVLLILFNPLIL